MRYLLPRRFDAATFGRLNFWSQFDPFGLSRRALVIVLPAVGCIVWPALVPVLFVLFVGVVLVGVVLVGVVPMSFTVPPVALLVVSAGGQLAVELAAVVVDPVAAGGCGLVALPVADGQFGFASGVGVVLCGVVVPCVVVPCVAVSGVVVCASAGAETASIPITVAAAMLRAKYV